MKHLYLLLILSLLAACSSTNTPSQPSTPKSIALTHGKMIYYGQHYDSVPHHVIALDLYSEGITFDTLGYMQGDGYNLYLSDIFVPITDTVLTDDTYHCDTTHTVRTFLPGMDFESNPTGTYVLQLKDSELSSLSLLTQGDFTYTTKTDSADITFTLQDAKKNSYTLSFHGVLTYEQRGTHL